MSTLSQIEANRRNSQLSTGPRTPEGKAVSRFNALKSGVNAKAQVIPGEDPAELEAMTTGYHREWAPTTYLERFLVDSLVRADWLLQRLARLEAELWAHEMEEARKSVLNPLNEDAPMGQIYTRSYERFTRLQRRIDSTERSYYRALTQLQRLRRDADPGDQPPLESPPSDPIPVAPISDEPPQQVPEPASAPAVALELASFCLPDSRAVRLDRGRQPRRPVPVWHDRAAWATMPARGRVPLP